MQKIKTALTWAAFTLLFSQSMNKTWANDTTTGTLSQGHWQISTLFSALSIYKHKSATSESTGTEFDLALAGEYFVADTFSMGAGFDFTAGDKYNPAPFYVGPRASFYFWKNQNWATYVRASFDFAVTNIDTNWILAPEVGARYFLNESIALGIAGFFRRVDRGSYDSTVFGPRVSLALFI